MFCLLKIAYDDTFHGFQTQPGIRTVQGEILRGLKPLGITKVLSSSRTDSHVRSAATVIEVEYDDVSKLCKVVDSLRGIAVTAYFVSNEFINLRSGIEKEYWYISPLTTDPVKLSYTINEFLNGNISNFSRDRNKKVMIEKIANFNGSSYTLLIFSGRSFSWNFVRISAETIIRRSIGQVSDEEWQEMLRGKKTSRFKGKPENLILANIKTNIPFIPYASSKIPKIRSSVLPLIVWLGFLDNSVKEFVEKAPL
ncbi:MAG: hypothetical protein QXM60_01255 [Thermoplasmatales archaeon]